jgi:hypothetical protein
VRGLVYTVEEQYEQLTFSGGLQSNPRCDECSIPAHKTNDNEQRTTNNDNNP